MALSLGFLGTILAPLYLKLLSETDLVINISVIIKQISLILLPPMLRGHITQKQLFYLIVTIIGMIVGKLFFQPQDGIALLYGTVMRNLSIALALAITTFGPAGSEIALIITMGYVIQIQLATWIIKLVNRLYHAHQYDSTLPPQVSFNEE